MKIFVDSSFIIALVNENDSLHESSLEYIDLIEKNECYISNLVINEVITVVGNKIDLESKRQVSKKEGLTLANQLNVEFYETSCLTNERVSPVLV